MSKARDRLARILGSVVDGDDPGAAPDRLCRACVGELGVSGAGLALISDGQHRGTLGASSPQVTLVEELQFTLGEGPSLAAHEEGRPALEPNLAGSTRWPTFGREAVAAGVAAAFALPLRVGAARFGALDLYRDSPGSLADGALSDALVVAEVATTIVVGSQDLAAPGSLPDVLAGVPDQRAIVHQATGMVSIQLDVTLEEALLAVRARAYADGLRVSALAADVVARRVRFEG